MNPGKRNVFRGIFTETVTILGWIVGSALHSIFTKKSFNKLSNDESIDSRIIYGSFLTIIQLLIAATTGICISLIIKLIKRNSASKNLNNETIINENNLSIEGSITESTCENRFEQTEGTQLSKSSSYILNENVDINNRNEEKTPEFYSNPDLDENINIDKIELNKEYNENTFNRFNVLPIFEEINFEKDVTTIKNESKKMAYHDLLDEGKRNKRWWGSNKMIFSAALYAVANICANTALGGGKVMLVQIIKCSELILTAVLAFVILKRKVTIREMIAFSISTSGIILVVTSTLSRGNANSKAVIYSVILASLGALTISLRNVIVSSENKNEKAIDTFTILSFWGTITSLTIFTVMTVSVGRFSVNIPLLPLIISGCFHATYNFSSLAFLKLVGSPIVHAYFNLAKRAIIVLTAELINCTVPPTIQILGSILAILGIHFSKEGSLKIKRRRKITNSEKKGFKGSDLPNFKSEQLNNNHSELKIKDKYPYTASIILSCIFIFIGWAVSYTSSCIIPRNGTSMDSTKYAKPSLISIKETNHELLNDNKIKEIIEIENWFEKYPKLLLYLSENKPRLLSESMKKYSNIDNNFSMQGNIVLSILSQTIGDVKTGMVFGLADHENKGDAGINWSQYMIFNYFDIRILYYCTSNKFHKHCDLNIAKKNACKQLIEPTIFLTGGGNLGGLWSIYENERREIFEKFREYNIVIFPQSLALKNIYENPNFEYLMRHKKLIIFVRDVYTFEYLKKLEDKNENSNSETAPKLFLIPDIVTSLFAIKLKTNKLYEEKINVYDIIWLNREDREAKIIEKNINVTHESKYSFKIDDWTKFSPTIYSKGISMGKKTIKELRDHSDTNNCRGLENIDMETDASFEEFSIGISLQRFCAGLEFIAQGKVIITNRLHGHIFSSLLKKKQVLLDTKYRKIRNYYDTWSFSINEKYVKLSDSDSDALVLAEQLLANTTFTDDTELFNKYCNKFTWRTNRSNLES
ncbi:Polysaccharide pyruvyl transferase [Cryptosporidium felis]|nr:Polysaccharide pyruvyl transferase [Cryptosporidium felis]